MSAEAEQQIQRVLAEHRSFHNSAGWNGSPDPSDWHNILPTCDCNDPIIRTNPDESLWQVHRAHVAAKVAEALAAQVPEGDERCNEFGHLMSLHLTTGCTFHTPAQVPDISARVEAKVDLWIAAAKALREQAAAMSSDRRGPRLNAADQYDYFAAELRALLDRPNGSE